MKKLVNILNINILSIDKNDLLRELDSGVVFTPNVDHLMKLQNDFQFYSAYNRADWIICDSRIVAMASKFLGSEIVETIPGSSFFRDFYSFHSNNLDIKIFLLGAAEGVAKKAMFEINNKIGREIVVGSHSPTFGFEKDDSECNSIINLINASDANVLVLGVGAPKQEIWIDKYKPKFNNIKIFMALGATIDFEAGSIRRAPKLYQKYGIEWLYRLMKEPKRLWKRYLIDDIPFFYLILLQKLNKYIDPFKK
jgi:exopolysaccharide biosynthesis WecB/TagA/CpsF family protein